MNDREWLRRASSFCDLAAPYIEKTLRDASALEAANTRAAILRGLASLLADAPGTEPGGLDLGIWEGFSWLSESADGAESR